MWGTRGVFLFSRGFGMFGGMAIYFSFFDALPARAFPFAYSAWPKGAFLERGDFVSDGFSRVCFVINLHSAGHFGIFSGPFGGFWDSGCWCYVISWGLSYDSSSIACAQL